MAGENRGLNKYLQAAGKCPGHLKGQAGLWGGRGLSVPGEPVVDVVQVSAQEYGERHEAELE